MKNGARLKDVAGIEDLALNLRRSVGDLVPIRSLAGLLVLLY